MSLLLLKGYKERIDFALEEEFTSSNTLERAMRYALLSGGKRVRPMITLMVAEGLGFDLNVMPSALAVEFSHTASIIADDLPCMDDEKNRRGRSCVHIEFDQATAILASYGLITAAYGKIAENGRELYKVKGDGAFTVLENTISLSSKASGCSGATLGQQLDLFEKPDSIEALENLIYLKTITFFEMAMIFGWMFGGGELTHINEVRESAYHLGMAFQVRDDLLDFAEDEARGCTSNFAVMLGREEAIFRFYKETEAFRDKATTLRIMSAPFNALLEILERGI